MPFTGSHAAAVVPLARWGLPASALVIGSFSPDLPYYLPISAAGSHTLVGLVTKDLLLGLAALVLWQAFVGRGVVALLPPPVCRRLAGYPVGLRRTFGGPLRLLGSVVALVLGGLTHLAWDLFTHSHGPIYDRVAWYRAPHGPLAGYQWVHLLSELVAVTVLSVWAARWWRSQPAATGEPDGRFGVRVGAAVLIVAAGVAGAADSYEHGRESGNVVFHVIVGAMSAGAGALVALAGAWAVVRRPA